MNKRAEGGIEFLFIILLVFLVAKGCSSEPNSFDACTRDCMRYDTQAADLVTTYQTCYGGEQGVARTGDGRSVSINESQRCYEYKNNTASREYCYEKCR